jgi:hypothetical protein
MIFVPLMLIAGFGAAGTGVIVLLAELLGSSDGPPTCDGRTMRPGDQCLLIVNGQNSSIGYEQMLRSNENPSSDWLVLGGALLGGGLMLMLSGWGLARWLGKV